MLFRTAEMALAGALALATVFPVAAGTTSERSRAKAVVEAYFQALNADNVARIVELYHGDAVFFADDAAAARGIEAIERTYRRILGKIDLDSHHKYYEAIVLGPVAIVESRSSGTITVEESGETRPTNNNELFVLRRDDSGDWRIFRYMFNGRGGT